MRISKRGQRGVAAIEFAMIFVILFAVFYAIISYAFPLLLLQSLNHAAAQAARATIKAETVAMIKEKGENEVVAQLEPWMPDFMYTPLEDNRENWVQVEGDVVTVTLEYPASELENIFPRLYLPGIGFVPQLPDVLRAEASISP